MPFKITIEETRIERKVKPKEWQIGAGEWDADHERYKSGYTPEVETLVSERRDIYMQIVDTLDLHDVIQAINGMPRAKFAR